MATPWDAMKERATGSGVGRTAVVYLPASWLVLQVVDTFTGALGLPNWVFTGTFVLLALGLILVMVSAVASDRLKRAAAAQGEAPARLRGWLSRRRIAAAGILVLSAWGLVAAGYMGARAAGIGPFGTLISSGAMAKGGAILIADFTNRTHDPDLDEAVRQAVAIDFGQSRLVEVVDPRMVAGALQRMEREPDAPLTPELAREVAQREGYAAVLEGDLAALGPATLITARLVSPRGEVLATFQQRAREPAELLDAVDRLIGELRNKVGESLKVLRAEPPLEQVTTSSLPALRLYSAAVKANNNLETKRAIDLLQRAVDVDPRFAMAWRILGRELRNLDRDPARARAAIETAYAQRERLPYRERGLTEAAYWSVLGDHERSRAAFARLLETLPNDREALHGLAYESIMLGDVEAAVDYSARMADLRPPTVYAYANLAAAQTYLGRAADAQATVDKAAALFPNAPPLWLMRASLSLARGELAQAEQDLAELRRRFPDVMTYEAGRYELYVRQGRGDLAGAARVAERLAAQDARDGLNGAAFVNLAAMARLHALSGDAAKGRAALEAARARFPFEAMRPPERPWFELAELSAMLGDAAAARRYLASGSAARGRDNYWAYDRAAATAGWIALAERRPEEAAERFRAAGERGQGNGTPMLWPLGRALEAAGRTEEARAVYRRRAGALFDEQPDLGLALERLASLDAAAGDRAGAEAALRRLATLWTAPESRTRVAALRQQLDALDHAGAASPLARTPRPGGAAKVGA